MNTLLRIGACWLLGTTTAIAAANTGAAVDPSGTVAAADLREPVIKFVNHTVTEEQAEQWAKSEGFRYVRMYSCAAPGKDDCLGLVVKTKKDKFFEYMLTDQTCDTDFVQQTHDVVRTGRQSFPLVGSLEEQTIAPETVCFAGFQTSGRLKTQHLFAVDADTYIQLYDATHQVRVAGRWQKTSRYIESINEWTDGGTKVTMFSTRLEDHDGTVLYESGVPRFATAIEPDAKTTASVDSRCQNFVDKRRADQAIVALSTEIALQFAPDGVSTGGAGVVAPGGGGVLLDLHFSWSADIGELTAESMLAMQEMANQTLLGNCYENPGLYFPDVAINDALLNMPDDFTHNSDFSPVQTVVRGICPATEWKSTTVGSKEEGWSCEVRAEYKCTEAGGVCNCEATGKYEEVCTGL